MARKIETSHVPSVYPGLLAEQHRVEGDKQFAVHTTREAAEQRAQELDDAENTDQH